MRAPDSPARADRRQAFLQRPQLVVQRRLRRAACRGSRRGGRGRTEDEDGGRGVLRDVARVEKRDLARVCRERGFAVDGVAVRVLGHRGAGRVCAADGGFCVARGLVVRRDRGQPVSAFVPEPAKEEGEED